MTLNRFLSAAVVFIICSLVRFSIAGAAPVTIASGTNANMTNTWSGAQRKVIYDDINGVYWAFFFDGSKINYRYSADGVTWAGSGNVSEGNISFSAAFGKRNGTGYVVLAVKKDNQTITVYKGQTSPTAIAFPGSSVTVFSDLNAGDSYSYPVTAVTDDYLIWVGAVHSDASVIKYELKRSNQTIDQALASFVVKSITSNYPNGLFGCPLVPLPGGEVLFLENQANTDISGVRNDGAANNGVSSVDTEKAWQTLASGPGSTVYAITTIDGVMYVGGSFQNAGSDPNADYIAKWDGSSFVSVAPGLNGTVRTIKKFNNTIWVGGSFAGGIKYLENGQWFTAGSGVTGGSGTVNTLLPVGSTLYLGGNFSSVDGLGGTPNVAAYSNGAFMAMGTGLNSTVKTLVQGDAGAIIAGGFIANFVKKWEGGAWSDFAPGLTQQVDAIVKIGSNWYFGGDFDNVDGDANKSGVVKWDGASFSALGSGTTSEVYALAVMGDELYAAGAFTTIGGVANTSRVARWNGTAWEALETGVDGVAYALFVQGSKLYLGGLFTGNTKAWSEAAALGTAPEISAAADTSGNVHIAYVNKTGTLVYKRYDRASDEFQEGIQLMVGASVTSPSVNWRSSSNSALVGFVYSNLYPYFMRGDTPFGAFDFDYSAIALNNVPVTTKYLSLTGSDPAFAIWTKGSSSPYSALAVPVPASRISGTVTLGGAPLPNVEIESTCAPSSAITDSTGVYQANLENGSCTITPVLAPYVFDPANRMLNISSNDSAGNDFVAYVPTATPPPTATPADPTETPTLVPTQTATPVDPTETPTLAPTATEVPAVTSTATSIPAETATPADPAVTPTAQPTSLPHTPTPTPNGPVVKLIAAKGKAGSKITLRYTVSDKTQMTSEDIRVLKKAKVLWKVKTKLAKIPKGGKKSIVFNSKHRKKGSYSWCVEAVNKKKVAGQKKCTQLKLN